ncbi:hypothetical protein [uncultured Microbacterium sp.]|uniref:hypothetical protein n=1 Tax=uncultured Microbacterium sp. TaxID=191216 RepID=UPI0028EF0E50|nr:hypothetical protein [uncultured Microbacterium sp.]
MRTNAGVGALPLVPLVAAVLAGIRSSFGPGVTVGLIVAVVLLPVWVPSLRAYRWAWSWLGLGLIAAATGMLLTWIDTYRPHSASLMAAQTLLLLALLGCLGVLLWSRREAGSPATATAFSLGILASTAISGVEGENAWKFGWSVPIYLVVLSIAMWSGRRSVELVAVCVLALTTVVTDSRSVTSFLVLAAALVLWQMRPAPARRRPRTWATIAGMGLMALSAYYAMQSLIYEGVFGEAALERSQAQIETSGSLIAGGRPELGASIALLLRTPLGIGSGLSPTAGDIWVAKTGMAALNYNPDNGYVDRFMFGGHFEVHSVLGDLWLLFGLPGALLGITALIGLVYGLGRQVARRQASALVIFVSAFSVWNIFFSPLTGSYRLLALALALVAVEVAPRRIGSRSSVDDMDAAGWRASVGRPR